MIKYRKKESMLNNMKKLINLIKKHKKKLLLFFVTIVIISIFYYFKPYIQYYFRDIPTKESLDALDLENVNNLMIVAHPDDETLWGGNALLEDNYLVVCLTNGNNSTRKSEFLNVMNKTGDISIILSYPDKIHGKRSDWSFCYNDITKDLETIINYKDWDTIVTHNEKGEYNHEHHIMTHSIVNDICDKLNIADKQFYFGQYYKRSEIINMKESDLPHSLSLLQTEKKIELIYTYGSQKSTILKLIHMLPFEKFDSRVKT